MTEAVTTKPVKLTKAQKALLLELVSGGSQTMSNSYAPILTLRKLCFVETHMIGPHLVAVRITPAGRSHPAVTNG